MVTHASTPRGKPGPCNGTLALQPVAGSFQNKDSSYSNSKPNEDAYFVNEELSCFAVFDGVTRSVVGDTYPEPSPARVAAEVFSATVQQVLATGDCSIAPRELLLTAVTHANSALTPLAEELDLMPIDYHTRDFPGLCGLIAIVVGEELHAVYNGDCSLYVASPEGHLTCLTSSQVPVFECWRDQQPLEERAQHITRKQVRNIPSHPFSYGVFTGEAEAVNSKFIQFTTHVLREGERYILTTDGFDPWFKERKSIDFPINPLSLAKEVEAIEQTQSIRSDDKTIVLLRCVACVNSEDL